MRTIVNRNFPTKAKVRKGKASQSVDTFFNADSRKTLQKGNERTSSLTSEALNAVNLVAVGALAAVGTATGGAVNTPVRANTPGNQTTTGKDSTKKLVRRGDLGPKA